MTHYRKIWQQHHNASLLPGIEIHHIDGDHNNSRPDNLLAVTIDEHLEIHLSQQDWGAVQAIRMRMELTDENRQQIKAMASLTQKELLKSGNHNWQLPAEERSTISRRVGEYTRDNKLGIHAINADPELAKQNSSNAGKASYAKKAGFHARQYQAESVGGTSWWRNTVTGKRKRSAECPGKDWTQSMGNTTRKGKENGRKGIPWWNDGNGNKIRAEIPPGDNWKRGMK
jgi:hypothetical protein